MQPRDCLLPNRAYLGGMGNLPPMYLLRPSMTQTLSTKIKLLVQTFGPYPEDNLKVLPDLLALAEQATKDRSIDAGESLIELAYQIHERITTDVSVESFYRTAIEILKEHSLVAHESLQNARHSLAWLLLKRESFDEAVALFEVITSESPEDGFYVRDLACAYEAAGRLEDALSVRMKARAAWTSNPPILGTPSVSVNEIELQELAALLSKMNREEEAEAIFGEVYQAAKARFATLRVPIDGKSISGRWHQAQVDSLIELVACLVRQGKCEQARRILEDDMPSDQDIEGGKYIFAPIAKLSYQRALFEVKKGRVPTSECYSHVQAAKLFSPESE